MKTSSLKGAIPWTIIVLIVALGYFQNAKLNEKLQVQSNCNVQILFPTVNALNERSSTSPELNESNRDRTKSEAKLFGFLVHSQSKPAQNSKIQEETFDRLVREYFRTIQTYLTVLGRTDIQQQANPYPTIQDYRDCLRGGK